MNKEMAFERICGNCDAVESITENDVIEQAKYYGFSENDEIVILALQYLESMTE